MQKLSLTRLLSVGSIVFLMLGKADGASGQYLVVSAPDQIAKVNPYRETDSKVPLVEALQFVKKQRNIKVAYKEGILDDKYVSPQLQRELTNLSSEESLRQLLSAFSLSFKEISNGQFTIFPSSDLNSSVRNASLILKGRVINADDGTPVPGANVTLKTNPQTGTVTDASGTFILTVPGEHSLPVVISVTFIGYNKQDYTVNDLNVPIVIELSQSANALNEIVVTALGISKEKKSVGYAVTEVKGSEFTQARENNIANALSGKVAGVNAIGSSTGPGGSSRVVIRGNGSLTGNNQPLYVVNGMPIDNTVPGGGSTTNGFATNVDRGDGISGINPDDIESMSVLKGGAAAALYGSRAANGVVLITTKKGRAQKGIGVEFNSTATMDNIAVFPDFQYEYGQGDGGVKPTTLQAAQQTGRRSFGSKIDGSTDYVAVDGLNHPYSAQKDNLKNFYQTGTNYTNSLALSGGNEKITYRFSAADLNSKGILPNNTFKRKTFNLSTNGKLNDKLSFEAVAQYNVETGHNRPVAGDAFANPNWTPYMIANTADVRWLDPGFDANGNEVPWNDATVATNGYFVINKFQQDDHKNRFIGQASVSYEFFKNLVVKGAVSRDFYNYDYTNILPTGSLYIPQGEYSSIRSSLSETNSMITASYKAAVFESFNAGFLAGVNRRDYRNDQMTIQGKNFIKPYFYSPVNLASTELKPLRPRVVTNSVFGSLDLDYKSILFLTLTGRTDWFSTLSLSENSIFYPGVSSSFILSDAIQLPEVFSLAKLRASYAKVGGGAPDAFATVQSYSNYASSGMPVQGITSYDLANSRLKPYSNTTVEGGMELALLNGRINLDLTYYDRKTTDDIIKATLSSTSGYTTGYLNVGEVSNRGIEMLLSGSPVKNKSFTWTTSYNLAYNKNKVIKLLDGINNMQVAATVGNWGNINNITGLPAGQVVGTRMLRDANDNIVFNKNTGLPVATGFEVLGDGVAPYTMGFTNEFKYGRFSLNVLLDGKFGNKVFSIMEVYATRLGLLKSTLPGRENGLELIGVDQEGNAYNRTVPVSGLRSYYDNYKNYSELFLHDGSFVKLRQVVLSYNIPTGILKAAKLQSANLSIVARNLAILYKKTDNFDPEQAFTNDNNQGFESIGLPRTRSFGLNLAVKF